MEYAIFTFCKYSHLAPPTEKSLNIIHRLGMPTMPSNIRGLLRRLKGSSSKKVQADLNEPVPFDPFDPIHDTPPQQRVDIVDIVDQDEMIQLLKTAVSEIERLKVLHPVSSFESMENTPWLRFIVPCEACTTFILSGKSGVIGTLEWLNYSRRAQYEPGPGGSLQLCQICWAVLRIRFLSNEWSVGDDSLSPSGYRISSYQRPTGLTVSLDDFILFLDRKVPFESQSSMIKPLDSEALLDPYARLVPMAEPKFDMIKSWLGECQTTHGSDCTVPIVKSNMDRDLTLIDVEQRCLVKAPGSTRFVALSYVWGVDWQLLHVDSNHDVLFRPGGFDDPQLAAASNAPLGHVVTDSMAITSKIGERYLWIDALCIKQDDREDKALEINRMASIYSGAYLTIVPVENSSAHSPIPGLGHANRGDMSEPMVEGIRVSVRDRITRIISASHYNTRGWCFQEAALSRRTLYFCEQQVYFRCQQGLRSEDSLEPWIWDKSDGQETTRAHLGIISNIPKWKLDHDRCDKQALGLFFDEYNKLVSGYWLRDLTDNSDVMDAFSAIGAALEVLLDARISAGLPEQVFHHALLWRLTTRGWGEDAWSYPDSVRPAIVSAGGDLAPSWSWLGWRGYCCNNDSRRTKTDLLELYQPTHLSLYSMLIPLISGLEIEDRGDARDIQVLPELYDLSNLDSTSSSGSCPHVDLCPDITAQTPPDKLGFSTGHNILRFWATAIPLESLNISFKKSARKPSRDDESNLYGDHFLLDSSSRHCGEYNGMAVDLGSHEGLRQRIDVVILSCPVWTSTALLVHKIGDVEKRIFDPAYEIAPWKSLCFMLVLWAEGDDGGELVCERLGIGSVHVDALGWDAKRTELIRVR